MTIANKIKFIETNTWGRRSKITSKSGTISMNEKTPSYYIRLSSAYKSYGYIKAGKVDGKVVLYLNRESGNKLCIEADKKTIRSSCKGLVLGVFEMLNVSKKGKMRKDLALDLLEISNDYAVLEITDIK